MAIRKSFFRLRIEADHEPLVDARTKNPDDLEAIWNDAKHKMGRMR